jgi:hypothetical protein
LPDGVGEAGKAGHEIVEHGQPRDPRGEGVRPLRVGCDRAARENLGDEKERRDEEENLQRAKQKL